MESVAKMIDHSLLRPELTLDEVRAGCGLAARYAVASVCVRPCDVPEAVTLPWIGDGHPVCDPVLMLIPAYRAIEAAARRRGFDPDNPPHLRKVTRTL